MHSNRYRKVSKRSDTTITSYSIPLVTPSPGYDRIGVVPQLIQMILHDIDRRKILIYTKKIL